MCGFVGIRDAHATEIPPSLLEKLTAVMAHRGPDDGGYLRLGPVALGHRRLAIIDRTDAAAQPMTSEDGTVALVYNGEVYNFRGLRRDLEARGHRFTSTGDTEVVLRAYLEWGQACVDRLSGMFAFSIVDLRDRTIFCARDRYGIKPLYWFSRSGLFLFASEIKSIVSHPKVTVDVCYPALDEYFTFQNIFSDRTLFEGIRLLPPGCTLTASIDGGDDPSVRRYWDFTPAPEPDRDADAWAEQLYHVLAEAVSRQLVSDVPVGAYLSGGIDSGSIVSLAVRELPRLTTFTAGFDLSSATGLELAFDERRQAEELANLLKTEHYEVVLHAGDMEWVLPELVWHLEDLRVGQSYPNYYAARLASRFAPVVLSGAGGDELFGGYPWRYYQALDARDGTDYLGRYYMSWQRLVPDDRKSSFFNEDSRRGIGDHSTFDVFRSVFDGWNGGFATPDDQLSASLYFELKTFLHGILLVEDKLSMAHSLETRVPLLDDALVDLARRIPSRFKVDPSALQPPVDENVPWRRQLASTAGKKVLRDAVSRLVPKAMAERGKQGFSAPDASWFRGESIDYVNALLRDPKARIHAFLDRRAVTEILDEHTSGRANRRLLIWSLLSFEWWCRVFLEGERVATR